MGASDSFSRAQNFANFSIFSPLRGEIMSNCHFQVKPTASKTNFSLVYRYFWRFWQSKNAKLFPLLDLEFAPFDFEKSANYTLVATKKNPA